MAQGLDELVEWLVGEVSFYGDGKSNLLQQPLAGWNFFGLMVC